MNLHTTRLAWLGIVAAAIVAYALPIAPTRAAESYDNCTGFIDTLPATITGQGTWCLRKDLSTAMSSGSAITVAANNVTIDCNDYKIGGLAAGPATSAHGIEAHNRLNTTIRRCNVRGFRRGIYLAGIGSGGHLIEDNRLNANTQYGLDVEGDGSLLRRNIVLDTGGMNGNSFGIRVAGSVDVLDNTISGVAPVASSDGSASATGILTFQNAAGSIRGNRIRGLVALGNAATYGINNSASGRVSAQDNQLVGSSAANSYGIVCSNQYGRMRDNIINGFSLSGSGCAMLDGNNDVWP